MARRPSKREDAVTTEPVADYDIEDQFVGGMDLSTALTIFTFLFILGGIGFVYYHLRTEYDVGKDPVEHYRGRDWARERAGVIPAGDMGDEPMDDGGGDAPADDGGGEAPAEDGGGSGDDSGESGDGFGD